MFPAARQSRNGRGLKGEIALNRVTRPQRPTGEAARAIRVAGHFGELMQGRMGPGGPVALVTLPCAALAVTARRAGGGPLAPHGGIVTPAQARRLLARLGLPPPGRVVLRADMPPGGGAGSSTAALVALARLAGFDGPPEALARACVAVEGATDPLMWPRPQRFLWASRRAEVLDRLPPVPPFDVVGGFFGPLQPTRPADEDFPDIADLVQAWRGAAGDLPTLARIATASAARTLAHRAPGTPDPTAALAHQTGALGWITAHTGAARGLIFAPGAAPTDTEARCRAAGLRGVLRFRAGG